MKYKIDIDKLAEELPYDTDHENEAALTRRVYSRLLSLQNQEMMNGVHTNNVLVGNKILYSIQDSAGFMVYPTWVGGPFILEGTIVGTNVYREHSGYLKDDEIEFFL